MSFGHQSGVEAVNATLEDGQLGFEFLEQAFSSAAVGLAGHVAIGLHQVGQNLIGPVAGVNVGELADAGDLLGGMGGWAKTSPPENCSVCCPPCSTSAEHCSS